MKKAYPLMLAGWLCVSCASRVDAVCQSRWFPSGGVAGVNGTVSVMTRWDPDGSGPQPECLAVGGSFSLAGTVAANNIACWNPLSRQWSAFGLGVEGDVHALAVLDGKLYVGGYLEGGPEKTSGLVFWDRTTRVWSAVGGGLSTSVGDRPPSVTALAVVDGNLYAAGYFTSAGGVAAANVARWNPSTTSWSALGSGVSGNVHAMAALGGKLYLGGEFSLPSDTNVSRIACWDPADSTWSALGSGVGGGEYPCVWALAGLGGKLYVGGDFTSAGESAASHLAVWDPTARTWSAAGAANAPVGALTVANGRIYAMPVAYQADIGCWDPAAMTWTAVAGQLSGGTAYSALDLAVLDGKLYVGSDFNAAAGVAVAGIACWDLASSGWSALGSGTDGAVSAMTVMDGKLYAGGTFTRMNGTSAERVAMWDPDVLIWAPLGEGIDGAEVAAFASFDGGVYVGGRFTTAGAMVCNHVARWNAQDSTWTSLGAGVAGSCPDVSSLVELGGDVYAAGSFDTAGGVAASNVACWTPASSTWSALGAGTDDRVNALAVLDGRLYAGGNFASAGGAPADAIAGWDPVARQWSPLASGLKLAGVNTRATVNALTVLNGKLYVAGRFTSAGEVSAKNIACWDASTAAWSPLGSGIDQDVHAMTALDGKLYVGGWFASAGGVEAASLAAWSPTSQTWSPVSIGTDESVEAVAVLGSRLFLGGYFTTAGGVTSASWARASFEAPSAAADLDRDCRVSGHDLEVFIDCASGPGVGSQAGGQTTECTLVPDAEGIIAADFDRDGDVDQVDFAALQRSWTGETVDLD